MLVYILTLLCAASVLLAAFFAIRYRKVNVYGRMMETYLDRQTWNRKSLVNIASAGFFSSDRSIREYAENIWHITPVR